MNESTPPPISVPDPGDPDRKRALNVLAQRRYRQRKREKMQFLESRMRSSKVAVEMPTPVIAPSPSPISLSLPVDVNNMAMDVMPSSMWNFQTESGLCQVQSYENFSGNLPTNLPLDLNSFISVDLFPNVPSHHQQQQSENFISEPNSLPELITPPNTSPPESQKTSSKTPSPTTLTNQLQDLETSQFTFPDDNLLEVPILDTMKAGLNIAVTLGCVSSLWDITTLRTFTTSQIPPSPFTIPTNLAPTIAQQRIPHYALFDIMPWPSVRTRIICVFAQPAHLRPEGARDADAVMKLFYDLDDEREGVRVSGNDYHDGRNWEIGQTLFENWWWAFDRDVVENSNALRRKRGAERLALPRR